MQPLRTVFPDWAVTGSEGRERRFLSSINIDPAAQETNNFAHAALAGNEASESALKNTTWKMPNLPSQGSVPPDGGVSAVRSAREKAFQ